MRRSTSSRRQRVDHRSGVGRSAFDLGQGLQGGAVSREPAIPKDLRPSAFESLVERYKHNPPLRALMTLIGGYSPPVGALESAVLTSFERVRSERQRELFDALDRGGIELTDEIIQQEEFIHAFLATARAANRTRQRQKIRLFARLLKAFVSGRNGLDVNEHEELLRVLEDLSPREFSSLVLLRQHEQAVARKNGETRPQWIFHFWEDAKHDLEQKLGFPSSEFEGFLARLSRTGLYRREIGFLDDAEEIGCTTPQLARLLSMLDMEEGDLLLDVEPEAAESETGCEE